jgi:probable O-glycosylation ligase (exosortase A-associated)
MRFLVVMLIYASGTVLAFRYMAFAAGLFLWNDIFQPLEFARNPGRFPSAYYVTAILILSYCISWFRGKIKPRFTAFFFLLCILMAWQGLTAVLSPFRPICLDQFILYLKYVGPLAFIHTALADKRDLRIVAAVLAGSVAVWSGQAGIYTLIHGANTDLGIPGGQMVDRNDFAAAIVGTVPILFYFLLSYDWKFKLAVRAGILVTLFLSISAIFFSLSRGASLGLAAQLLLFVGYVSKHKIRDGILIVCVAGIGFLFLPQDWFDRMSTIKVGTEQTEGSAKARMNLIVGAYHASLDYPVFGLGPGGWLEMAEAYTGDNHNPHNIYLVLSSETGITGLLLYLLVIGFTYVQVYRTINRAVRRGDKETARLGSALITAIFGLLAAMTFLNRPFNEYLWGWLALANALPAIDARDLARARRVSAKGQLRPPAIPPNATAQPL